MSRMPRVLCMRCATVTGSQDPCRSGSRLRTGASRRIDIRHAALGERQRGGAGELPADGGNAEADLRPDRHAGLQARLAGMAMRDQRVALHHADGDAG